MSKEVTLEHFAKAAREVGAHGDNDTLPFDLDNRFISDCHADIAQVAYDLFQTLDKGEKRARGRQLTLFPFFMSDSLYQAGPVAFGSQLKYTRFGTFT